MRTKVLIFVVAVTALGAGLFLSFALTRTGSQVPRVPPVTAQEGGRTLEEFLAFNDYPLYWLGEEYQGLPIVKIRYMKGQPPPGVPELPTESWRLIYASCKPGRPAGGGSTEGYCAPGEYARNVQVMSERFCLKPPSLLVDSAREGAPLTIRGAVAQNNLSNDLQLYTGESTVSISASEGGWEAVLEAARNLRGANALARAAVPAAAAPLPPPISEEECEGLVWPAGLRRGSPLGATGTPPPAAPTWWEITAVPRATLVPIVTATPEVSE